MSEKATKEIRRLEGELAQARAKIAGLEADLEKVIPGRRAILTELNVLRCAVAIILVGRGERRSFLGKRALSVAREKSSIKISTGKEALLEGERAQLIRAEVETQRAASRLALPRDLAPSDLELAQASDEVDRGLVITVETKGAAAPSEAPPSTSGESARVVPIAQPQPQPPAASSPPLGFPPSGAPSAGPPSLGSGLALPAPEAPPASREGEEGGEEAPLFFKFDPGLPSAGEDPAREEGAPREVGFRGKVRFPQGGEEGSAS